MHVSCVGWVEASFFNRWGGRFVITVCNEILFFKFSWNRLTDDVWMYAGTSILYIGEFSGGCYVSCLHRYIFQIR
jgi:hypothetical protein